MSGDEERVGWLKRLTIGLTRTSRNLTYGIGASLTRKRLDSETLEALEEALLATDLGFDMASRFVSDLRKTRFGHDVSIHDVKEKLAVTITEVLQPVAKPLVISHLNHPHIILVVGVNGSGKTTTIGKLGQIFRCQGHKVMLVAGDTFRAAAVEQLVIWGERLGLPVVTGEARGDAAALAFRAIEEARRDGSNVILIDTAGRLHTRHDLMEELSKVIRVVRKLDPAAPHDCVLVLDAAIGQNALIQIEAFHKMAAVTGLIVTKLDGTAKGGVVVALADRFKLPIHAVGVGETADDLRPFAPEDFARSLVDLPLA